MPDSLATGNSQNNATPKKVHTRSKFDLKYHNFDTFRFGELHPHFVMESVPSDSVHLRCEHNLRSYSLKAPLMQKIQMKKDYFAVPMEAILPFNWDKVYTNPVIGDDVPSDAGTYVANFTSLVQGFLSRYTPDPTDTGESVSKYWEHMFRWLLTAELFYSNGNLLSSLGIHLSRTTKWNVTGSYAVTDGCVDDIIDIWLLPAFNSYISGFVSWKVQPDSSSSNEIKILPTSSASEVRAALEMMRDNLGTFVLTISGGSSAKSVEVPTFTNVGLQFGLDIKRVLAYQLVCAHYYSNDHVDYVYSAELYREYVYHLIKTLDAANAFQIDALTFNYNGLLIRYDYLSARQFSKLVGYTSYIDITHAFSYLQALFSYRHSLRYIDYFVGSKTRPLAVGDVNVAVNSGSPNYVNIVDVTQRTQMQRFLNAVNRSGRKFSNYIQELFGNNIAPDYHNPFYLGHTSDDIYGQEIENTNVVDQESSNQGLSIVSNLRSNASRFEFNFDCDRPCILIGITYFDISRAYYTTIERQNFHKDRFDMFNPYMQFVGDQEVYGKEIQPTTASVFSTFGYQLRHMEYKQRYNQCSGGFVDRLPGYVFKYEVNPFPGRYIAEDPVISPSFIRSKSTELDRFYLSLTGFSLGYYFHFIVDNFNDCQASRPMAYAPSIL